MPQCGGAYAPLFDASPLSGQMLQVERQVERQQQRFTEELAALRCELGGAAEFTVEMREEFMAEMRRNLCAEVQNVRMEVQAWRDEVKREARRELRENIGDHLHEHSQQMVLHNLERRIAALEESSA